MSTVVCSSVELKGTALLLFNRYERGYRRRLSVMKEALGTGGRGREVGGEVGWRTPLYPLLLTAYLRSTICVLLKSTRITVNSL